LSTTPFHILGNVGPEALEAMTGLGDGGDRLAVVLQRREGEAVAALAVDLRLLALRQQPGVLRTRTLAVYLNIATQLYHTGDERFTSQRFRLQTSVSGNKQRFQLKNKNILDNELSFQLTNKMVRD
jgi:hypothetical protein